MSPRISSRQLELMQNGAAARVDAGRRAQRVGTDFENALEAQHDEYRLAKMARLQRHELPTRPSVVTTNHGKLMMRKVTGSAPYDFAGVLGPGSPWPRRAIAVEAKHTSDRPKNAPARLRLKTPKNKAGLGRDQLDLLVELYVEWGAMVALVWECVSRVGYMGGMDLVRFRTKLIQGGPEYMLEQQFAWLPVGSLDYLRPLIAAEQLRTG